MEIFLFWFIFSIIVGVAAANRGRSGLGWFFISMLISPVLGLILVLVIPRAATTAEQRASKGYNGAPTSDTHVKCPDCRELVLKDARVCKHCGCRLVPISDATGVAGKPYSEA